MSSLFVSSGLITGVFSVSQSSLSFAAPAASATPYIPAAATDAVTAITSVHSALQKANHPPPIAQVVHPIAENSCTVTVTSVSAQVMKPMAVAYVVQNAPMAPYEHRIQPSECITLMQGGVAKFANTTQLSGEGTDGTGLPSSPQCIMSTTGVVQADACNFPPATYRSLTKNTIGQRKRKQGLLAKRHEKAHSLRPSLPILSTEGGVLADMLADVLAPSLCASAVVATPLQDTMLSQEAVKSAPLPGAGRRATRKGVTTNKRSIKDRKAAYALLALCR